jgi:NAD(P)-dependent dehydrogenase (short-subunit alcohol dehydrogenase family)
VATAVPTKKNDLEPTTMNPLSDATAQRTVLVTGGGRGIGAATARVAAHRGWAVAVNYMHDAAAAQSVVAAIRADGGRALALQADVSVEAQVLAMYAEIDRGLPPLGALVNNAGVVDLPTRVDAISVDRLQRMFAINVFGSFVCAREAVNRMSSKHGGHGGAIVNLSSAAARLGAPGQYVH